MNDEDKPAIAVLVKNYVEFSKWLKVAKDKDKVVYRPVFSMNSSVGICFDAMITTPKFWKLEDAEEIHLYVRSRIANKCRGVNASNGTFKKQSLGFLEKAFRFFWCRDRG